MAHKEPRYEKNRLKLQDHIPFDTPLALHVDVSSACNFECSFCANHSPNYKGSHVRKYEVMDYGLFTKIIDDLAEFESQIKSLRLYNVGEPLINKNLPKMIKYAKCSNMIECIDTTTNGVLLTPQLSDALIEAGLDKICFSVVSMTKEGYKEITNTEVDFNKLVENISYFFSNRKNCTVHVKTLNISVPTDVEKEKFYNTFDNICNSMWIDSIVNVWPEFEAPHADKGSKNMYNEEITPLIVCTQPFYNLSVNPDGTVTHCDLDWKNELVVGDLNKQTLKEIWESEVVYNTQLLHLKGEREKIKLCSDCPWPENGCIDNFDAHREMVLKRFIEKKTKL